MSERHVYEGPTEEERVAAERALIENDGGAYCTEPRTRPEPPSKDPS